MKIIHKNLVRITLSSLIYTVSGGLVGVFLPLILLGNGLQLWQMCGFYVIYGVFKILLNYPVFLVINRRGPIFGLSAGYAASAAYFVFLSSYIASDNILLLVCASLCMAIMNSFLWNSSHLYISKAMEESRKSRDLAMISNITRVITIFVPLIGGLLAVTIGSFWLTFIAAVISMLSIIPMISFGGSKNFSHEPVNGLKYGFSGAPKRDLVANASFNAHTLVGVMVWPIYLAVFIPSFTQIGYIDAISTAVAVIVLYFTAKRSDKGKSHKVLIEGTAMSSIVHLSRVFASNNPFTITLISSFYDVALSYQLNPWVSIYYGHAKRRGLSYILSMEIAGDIAYIFTWGLLGVVAFATKSTVFFLVAFNFAAVVAWATLFITKDSKSTPTTH